MLKIGIIGAGRLGSFHADKAVQHPLVQLAGVTDPCESARTRLAQKHRIPAFNVLEEMLPTVDAVIIASPTVHHFSLGNECLLAGKHVLMEKPMCATLAESRTLVELAKQRRLVLQVGHVEEFNPAWTAAKQLFREDIRNGEPIIIDAVRASGYTFRSTDVGSVFDMMIHDIDLVLSLAASRVYSVDAVGFHVIGGQHEDVAHARLRFENGWTANLFSSRVAEKAERTMQITTATASIKVDFATRTTSCHRANEMVLQHKFAPQNISANSIHLLAPTFMADAFSLDVQTHDVVDALAAELDDFVQSIQFGTVPRVSGSRALEAISVAETIVRTVSKTGTRQKSIRRAA